MRKGRRWIPVLAGAGVTVVALAALGNVLAPSWQRPRLPADPRFDSLRAPQPAPEPPRHATLRREPVRVPVAGGTLAGTVIAPAAAGAMEKRPAVVFVHGGGPATQAGLARQAERLARAGVVTLVYDKRRAGYSYLRRDYGQLADDALAMARLLHARPDVDPDRVGLWGVSEGGWVAPLAASRSRDVRFVILVAAPTMSPSAQLAWAADDGLRRQGAPEGARRLVSRALTMGNLDYAGHDPIPALEGMRQPVLALYPAADRAVPPLESAQILADALDRAGNRAYTIRFFERADHAMRVDGVLAPGYIASMARWIRGLPGTGAPAPGQRITGAPPRQPYAAVAGPDVPWHGSGPVLAAVFGLVAAGYLAGPTARAVRRWRRGRPGIAVSPTSRELRRRIRRMTIAGVATAVGINVVIGGLAALAFTGGPGLVSQGLWLSLRLVSLAAAVLAAAAAVAVAGAVRDGWRPDGTAAVSLAGAFTAAGLVLLLAAYWGLFHPAW